MEKQIRFFAVLAVLFGTTAVTLVGIKATNSDAGPLLANAQNNPYLIKVDKPLEFKDGLAKVYTGSKYGIDLLGRYFEDDNTCVANLMKTGSLENSMKLKGLETINVTFEGDLSVDKGYAISDKSEEHYFVNEYYKLQSGIEYKFTGASPTYFKLKANENTKISNIEIKYSCSEEVPNIKNAYNIDAKHYTSTNYSYSPRDGIARFEAETGYFVLGDHNNIKVEDNQRLGCLEGCKLKYEFFCSKKTQVFLSMGLCVNEGNKKLSDQYCIYVNGKHISEADNVIIDKATNWWTVAHYDICEIELTEGKNSIEFHNKDTVFSNFDYFMFSPRKDMEFTFAYEENKPLRVDMQQTKLVGGNVNASAKPVICDYLNNNPVSEFNVTSNDDKDVDLFIHAVCDAGWGDRAYNHIKSVKVNGVDLNLDKEMQGEWGEWHLSYPRMYNLGLIHLNKGYNNIKFVFNGGLNVRSFHLGKFNFNGTTATVNVENFEIKNAQYEQLGDQRVLAQSQAPQNGNLGSEVVIKVYSSVAGNFDLNASLIGFKRDNSDWAGNYLNIWFDKDVQCGGNHPGIVDGLDWWKQPCVDGKIADITLHEGENTIYLKTMKDNINIYSISIIPK